MDLRVFGFFQLYPDNVILNFIALDPVVMGELREGLLFQRPNSMVLIRGNANGLFVLNEPVSFDKPVATRGINIRDIL
jgi:hypothetical protein